MRACAANKLLEWRPRNHLAHPDQKNRTVRTTLTQNRRCISEVRHSLLSLIKSFGGPSSMLQIGQLPGASRTIWRCNRTAVFNFDSGLNRKTLFHNPAHGLKEAQAFHLFASSKPAFSGKRTRPHPERSVRRSNRDAVRKRVCLGPNPVSACPSSSCCTSLYCSNTHPWRYGPWVDSSSSRNHPGSSTTPPRNTIRS